MRLFVRAGHEVVPLVTPGADRFVRAETFYASPGRSLRPGSIRIPAGRSLRDRAAHGQHAREARLRHRRQRRRRGRAHPRRALARRAGDGAACGTTRRRRPTSRSCARVASSSSAPPRKLAEEARRASATWPSLAESRARGSSSGQVTGLLLGKTVVGTAGGTREPIDAPSLRRQPLLGPHGRCLAEETRRRRAEVTMNRVESERRSAHGRRGRPGPDSGGPGPGKPWPAGTPTSWSWLPPSPTTGRPTRTRTSGPQDGEPWRLELEPTDDVLNALETNRERPGAGRVRRRDRRRRRSTSAGRRTKRVAGLVVYNDVAGV